MPLASQKITAHPATVAPDRDAPRDEPPRVHPARRVLGALSVRNVGAVYVWIAIIVIFSLISPSLFPTAQTAKSIVNEYAVTGLVALALVVPLAAGVYDLSIGYTMSFAGVLIAHLLTVTSLSPALCLVVTMLACVAIGLLNSLVVVVLKVDSFIGTLGTGAIIQAINYAISGDQPLVLPNRANGFEHIASSNVSNFTLPVLYLLVVMVAIAFWLERTADGRQIYATGFDRETARLTGAPVRRVITTSLITSAVIAGFAGVVLAARVSSADPDAGTQYLIPAFSAAFLGATQIRAGRFNSWGTVIAVMLLGTGNIGLLLAGGPTWTPTLFNGTVLIAAVALTRVDQRALRSRLGRRRQSPAGGDASRGAPTPPAPSP
jgi:ribose transport system permease protein